MIHPTAVIHPTAQIGAECDLGPYCVVGENVVLGCGCRLHSHVVIEGHTQLGRGNEIFPFASVGLKTQDLKWKGGLTRTEIGDDNTFREYVTIHSATGPGEVTRIGSNNHILAYSHIAHNVWLGSHVVMSNVATLAGHVTVEDYAVIGGLAAVPQFCRIGKMGMERHGVSETAQTAMRMAYKILFREGLTIPNALARIETELPKLAEVQHLVEFVRSSQRGISK